MGSININPNKCLSVKKKGSLKQCNNKKKVGDYCKVHAKCKNIVRIDEVIKNDPNIELSGPAYIDICLSHDNVDIISLEKLWIKNDKGEKIPKCEFDRRLIFSYEDNGIIRCFNIKSLYHLFKNKIYKDPFTNKAMNPELIDRINKKIEYIQSVGISLEYKKKKISKSKEVELKVVDAFKKFDSLGFYMRTEWFTDLDIQQLKKIYMEGKGIWSTFVSTNPDAAAQILPHGTTAFNDNNAKSVSNKIHLQNIVIDEFHKLLFSGINENAMRLGAYILVGIFAYVSSAVKEVYGDFMYN